jgi:hypothetical protein
MPHDRRNQEPVFWVERSPETINFVTFDRCDKRWGYIAGAMMIIGITIGSPARQGDRQVRSGAKVVRRSCCADY